MYKNIGGKLKGLAISIFSVLSLLSIITGVITIISGDELKILGWCYILFGPIIAWTLTLTTYGFGVLLDKALDIEYNTREKGTIAVSDRMAAAKSFLERGIISEEEYLKVLSNVTVTYDIKYYEKALSKLCDDLNKGIIDETKYSEQRKSIIDKL